MSVVRNVLAVAVAGLSLAACSSAPATSGKLSIGPTPAGSPQIVVFRPQSLDHFARRPVIEVNGLAACELANGQAMVRNVAPNPKTTVATSLWDWPGTSRVTFAADAGVTYFVRLAPNPDKRMAGVLGGHPGVWLAEAFSDRSGPFLLDIIAAEQGGAEAAGMLKAACD